MSAWSTGGAYVNYLDPMLSNWQQACYGRNYAPLLQVKKTCDPKRVLTMPQRRRARRLNQARGEAPCCYIDRSNPPGRQPASGVRFAEVGS